MNLDDARGIHPWMANQHATRISSGMAEREIDVTSVDAIASRLTMLRRALAGDNQAEFCRKYGFDARLWNNYERAVSRISIDNARKLWRKTGVGFEWIYTGVDVLLPRFIADKFREIEIADAAKARKRA